VGCEVLVGVACMYISLIRLAPPISTDTKLNESTFKIIVQARLATKSCSTLCHLRRQEQPQDTKTQRQRLRSMTPIPILKASSHNQYRE
jgi:hypothetical protein